MAEFPTYEKMAKEVAEKALDEILYDGKSIREWMKIIAEQEPCEDCCNGNQLEKAKLCQRSYIAGMEHRQEPKTMPLICLRCKKDIPLSMSTFKEVSYTHYSYCEDCLRKGLKALKAWDELYKRVYDHHYEILRMEESEARSAKLSLSNWVLDIMTSDIDYDYKSTELEQEPSENAVSREAVNNLQKYRYNCGDTSITCVSLASINELPPVTPQPKTGHWIISPNDCFVHCSECGLHGDKGIYKNYRWCPNCGCRMESEG